MTSLYCGRFTNIVSSVLTVRCASGTVRAAIKNKARIIPCGIHEGSKNASRICHTILRTCQTIEGIGNARIREFTRGVLGGWYSDILGAWWHFQLCGVAINVCC